MDNVLSLKANMEQLCKSLGDNNFGDVMVVGGGISGIQASLDLGTAGFKVYLVDAAPTIGGHMAQLDKTFPTNDCSMCIESPKFVECNRHPNIEIMTYTEVDRVEGEAGISRLPSLKSPDTSMRANARVAPVVQSTARSGTLIDLIRTYRRIKLSIYTSPRQFPLSLI